MDRRTMRAEARWLGQRKSTLHAHRSNDLKLSDRGVRRGTCTVGGKAAAEADAVTHGAVRCSAWLGYGILLLTWEWEWML